jgi:FlaG/FlaF family flagellin (archaellin)
MHFLANQKNVSRQLLLQAMCLLLFLAASAVGQTPTPSTKDTPMTQHATGPFDVKVTHQDENSADPLLARMTLDKQYHGEIEATGQGQMLTAGTAVKGSGAYVAIEKVTGTLKGRTGSFVLQHVGTMTQNVPQLTIIVVPDSGTGQLEGITGKMIITIAPGGKHSYDFEYTLPAAP